jgi:hypothetical protein
MGIILGGWLGCSTIVDFRELFDISICSRWYGGKGLLEGEGGKGNDWNERAILNAARRHTFAEKCELKGRMPQLVTVGSMEAVSFPLEVV